jgi:hypothetical protein
MVTTFHTSEGKERDQENHCNKIGIQVKWSGTAHTEQTITDYIVRHLSHLKCMITPTCLQYLLCTRQLQQYNQAHKIFQFIEDKTEWVHEMV